jgi:carbonic anhydrase
MPKITRGIVRFKTEVYPEKKELFGQLAKGQNPEALFITCSDSRIDPNLLVQTEPGELFIIRNAGNIVPPHTNHTGGVTASIEYAVAVLGVKHIIICGHSRCGALIGVLNPASVADLPHVTQWLSYAKAAHQIVEQTAKGISDDEKLDRLVEQNVLMQLRHIKTHPHVAARLATGEIRLHGWVYDIGSGDVRAYDAKSGSFVPVEVMYAQETREFMHSLHDDSGCCGAPD